MMENALEIADVEEKNMKIADVGIENCDKRGRVENRWHFSSEMSWLNTVHERRL